MQMRRVSIVGCSGSGKTTVAKDLAVRLGVPHIELDALYHQRDWQPTPRDDLRARLVELTEAGGWVVDGNYHALVQDIVWGRADTVVWLDPSRRAVMWAVVRRTLGRMILRTELWNGNRERFRNLFDRRPEENIILWSWTQFPAYRARYGSAMADPTNDDVAFVRLTSRRETHEWLASVGL